MTLSNIMNLNTLITIAGVTAYSGGYSFVIGSVAALCGVISKYALPKLGYQTIGSISIATVSRNAFKTAAVCYSFSAVVMLAIFTLLACLPPIGCCGGNDI
jgi:hypothetical protein